MAKKKENHQNKFFKQRIAAINKVLSKLETEIEKTLDRFMKRGEESSKVIKKNFDEIIDRISASDLYSKASEKTEALTKELRRVTDDIVNKLKKLDFGAANSFIKEAKDNLEKVYNKIQDIEIVELAKDKAISTRDNVLHALKIPTQDEIGELTKKVSSLEKKLKTLSHTQTQKAA